MAIDYKIFTEHSQLPNTWDAIANHDVFLQSTYFKALQHSSPNNITWYYVGIFKDEHLVGIAIIQRVQLYVKDMFRITSNSQWKAVVRSLLSKVLKGNILVVGNLMQTGQHGVFFDKYQLSQNEYIEALFKALHAIKTTIKQLDKKTVRVLLFKDYFEDDVIPQAQEHFKQKGFHQLSVQPNMLMNLPSNWQNFDDYLNDLSTKYRTRYKRALKKLGAISIKELETEDIQLNSNRLYELYKNVSNNAPFNTFILHEQHFYQLKKELQNKFKVFGYFLNDDLIGFHTLILNNQQLETYFLGYDEAHQHSNQLYLNMLYQMLRFGIDHRFETIVYARTAMEIKSSVGAKAVPMSMYLKHTNNFINVALKGLFKVMNPSQTWEERHPFK
jgi:hypothetical protein